MSRLKVKTSTTILGGRLLIAGLVALAALLTCAPIAHAAPPAGSAGTIGFYFDEELTQTTLEVTAPSTPVTVYIGISGLDADLPGASIDAWEMGYDISFVSQGLGFLLNTALRPGSIDFGSTAEGFQTFAVGTGGPIDASLQGDKFVVATIQMLFLSPPSDLRFTPEAARPSSIDPAAPAWNDVSGDSPRLFEFANVVSATINPVPCEVEDASFDGTFVRGLDGGGSELWSYDAGKTVLGVTVADLDGDGDNNVVYWTEDDGAENGEIGYLDCQGNLLWNFVDSGLACDPADANANYLDVVDFRLGDFDAGNPGDELLLISTAPGLSRLTLHALDGSLINGNAEIWTDISYGAVLVTGGNVYFGGANADGVAAVLRDALDGFRGSTIGQAPCVEGGLTERTFAGDLSAIETLAVTDGVLTATSGNSNYEVDATTLEDIGPSCVLDDVSFDGAVLTGRDAEGLEAWTYTATADIVDAFVAVGDAPEATAIVADGTIVRLDCFGAELESFAFANCYADSSARSLAGPVTTANGTDWYLVTWTETGNTRLTSLASQTGAIVEGSAYDLPGTPTASLLVPGAPATDDTLYLGFANGLADGSAHVIALDPADISGAAPPVQGNCTAGSEIWSTIFDDLTGAVDALEIVEGALNVTVGEDVRQLDPATGVPIVQACELVSLVVTDATVSARDANDDEIWSYTANANVVDAVPSNPDAPASTFATIVAADGSVVLLDCFGELVDDTFAFANCYGDTGAQELAGPVVTANGIRWYLVTWTETGNTRLTSLLLVDTPESGVAEGSAFDFPGTPSATALEGEGTDQVLYVGFANGLAAGNAMVVAIDPDDVSGAAPPVQGDCTAGSEIWSVLFDGSGDLPAVAAAPSALVVAGGTLEVTVDGASYLLSIVDGGLLTDVELSVAPASGAAKPGETYAITLELGNAANLAAVQGALTYDATALAVVDARSELTGFSNAINTSVDGEVRFAIASEENLGSASATLMTIEFEVLAGAATGDVAFGFDEVLAFDETPSPIGIVTTGGTLAIGCETKDVTGDGQVRSDDAVLTLRIGVGLVDPTPAQLCAADVNEDGVVDSGDAVMILREVVGLPTGIGVGRQVATLQIDGNGVFEALGDGRYAVELIVRGNDVAGIDLTIGAPNGFRVETVGLVDASGVVAFRQDRSFGLFAAANATALGESGGLRVRAVLRGDELAEGSAVEMRVLEASTYATDGSRSALESVATLTFEAPTNEIALPHRTELLQNAPNPFNPRTEISFRLAQDDAVRVVIYDVAGRRVSTLNLGTRNAGEHSVVWTGTDESGRPVSSGVYLYQLQTSQGVVGSKRMTLVR